MFILYVMYEGCFAFIFFFFQAEDGIRDIGVTGVQTCALPISRGWAFKDVLPYFKRCEDWEGGASEWRGAGGPLRIERSRAIHPVAAALIEGAAEFGIPVIDDPNGATNEGAAPSNFNIR